MTTATKQTVETLAQEYCEKITEANAEWIKQVRINGVKEDGYKCKLWFDEDGNYTGEKNAPYWTYIIGRKYLKVISMEWKDDAQYGRINAAPAGYVAASVHAFIDKNTGEVFKAAAWSAPAKGVRYNILTQTETLLKRAGNDGGFGGYLYY